MAAMIADPQDLLEGKKGEGGTVVATGNKAIESYRETGLSPGLAVFQHQQR